MSGFIIFHGRNLIKVLTLIWASFTISCVDKEEMKYIVKDFQRANGWCELVIGNGRKWSWSHSIGELIHEVS